MKALTLDPPRFLPIQHSDRPLDFGKRNISDFTLGKFVRVELLDAMTSFTPRVEINTYASRFQNATSASFATGHHKFASSDEI